MPGAPFQHAVPSFQDVDAGVRGIDVGNPGRAGSHLWFLLWLVVIGVVIPSAILGGLNLYGFQFVFRSR